ncbi:MAG: Fic family protein [Candidatus Vogelbacteria bacterium]|nr:Fic family protein [Candidatus Vogelbacteria bacterium]
MRESIEVEESKSRNLIKDRELKVPENLNDDDTFLISKQCTLQHAMSDEQLKGFAEAYSDAKSIAGDSNRLSNLTIEEVIECIEDWGIKIERDKNKYGYRTGPASFRNLSTAAPHQEIPARLNEFAYYFVTKGETPIELYSRFEKIHPFKDGNGRVGDLLWKLAVTRETGKWPEALPPDVFGAHK